MKSVKFVPNTHIIISNLVKEAKITVHIAFLNFCTYVHHFSYSNSFLNPVGNYMFKVYNRNARTRCEICSKLTIKIPEHTLF